MKKFLVITLVTVTVLCVSCVQRSTREKVVGHWVDQMYNEYVFNEDGTGQQGNTAILGLSDMTWEMNGDTILLKNDMDDNCGNQVDRRIIVDAFIDTVIKDQSLHIMRLRMEDKKYSVHAESNHWMEENYLRGKLSTPGWLMSEEGLEWLGTNQGKEWMASKEGTAWLASPEGQELKSTEFHEFEWARYEDVMKH